MIDFSVFVLTYSGNKDVLKGFLKNYERNAVGMPEPIVISDYTVGHSFEILKESSSFSDRLINGLKCIQTPFVLLLLDDYYILEKIDVNEINNCLDLLYHNRNIISTKLVKEERFEEGVQKAPLRYGLSLGAGIWRVSDLLEMLKPNESAWDIELKGSFRLWKSNLSVSYPSNSIIKYPAGGVIHKGKVPAHLTYLVEEGVLETREILKRPEPMIKRRFNLLMTLIKFRK